MPSDKSIICLGQNQSWGHWEQRTFCVHPGVQLDIPVEINIGEPFEIHVGAGSHLQLLDGGNEFICYMERDSHLQHLGTAKKAHFILEERATLVHKNVVQKPRWEASDVHIELIQKEAHVDWGEGVNLQSEESYWPSIKIEHLAPHTHSECCLKSIIRDNGNLNFICDMFIHRDAVKSTTHQKNLNHVLSPQGHVTARPRLHIFNKEIEASHGTATQPIPDDVLFYLRSRGLSLQQAEQLYLESFLRDFYAENLHNDGQ